MNPKLLKSVATPRTAWPLSLASTRYDASNAEETSCIFDFIYDGV
jgi:hypothetical protein